jgi:hypothetical protein
VETLHSKNREAFRSPAEGSGQHHLKTTSPNQKNAYLSECAKSSDSLPHLFEDVLSAVFAQGMVGD